ncbi:MAG: hypothetical protein KAI43_06795 [Candidatus Aureabacteria bacterium]|nr:hypothetical protein [Candidatus Auribacterota bacterium]
MKKEHYFFIAVLLIIATFIYLNPDIFTNQIKMRDGDIKKIHFLSDFKNGIPSYNIEITKPESISSVLKALREAIEFHGHGHETQAVIMIEYLSGVKDEIYLALCHNTGNIELIYLSKTYSVNRKTFLEALDSSGIDTNKFIK